MTPPTSAVWVEWFLPAYQCLQGPGWKVYPSFLDIVHDFGYTHRINSDGKELSFWQWNIIFYDLNRESWNRPNQLLAGVRFFGVTVGGGMAWKKAFKPIPEEHKHLYEIGKE